MHRSQLPRQIIRVSALVLLAHRVNAAPQDVVTTEAEDLAEALEQLDQSFQYPGLRSGHGTATVGGARYRDQPTPQPGPVSAPTGQGLPQIGVEVPETDQ
ncbi:hypothetical protein [Abyssibacter sp.]|jgi:hypothetical protein|uniref:hypothetical protein n=1 Tax=Abyssibacter sp. TaxID=2320200 RepID=UPI000C4E9574|nr:hypothetical protein [Abyssibacter sp.]MBB87978.1 hypothetical protein [Xanthomonadales bacterium]MCK5860078.1 hypothetical protein [Abyssibacter sp.]